MSTILDPWNCFPKGIRLIKYNDAKNLNEQIANIDFRISAIEIKKKNLLHEELRLTMHETTVNAV